MNIILSNDDGIKCQGLISLANKLSEKNKLLVVAPDGNRSASSHSLSIFKKIKFIKDHSIKNCTAYKTSGTPADCVKFAKLRLADFDADIVVSGINVGHNIGTDTLYSGTVSIACEASFYGNIAFAFSAHSERPYFDQYAIIANDIIEQLLNYSNKGDIWNINFPDCEISEIKGIKMTQLGKQLYSDEYILTDKDEYMLVGKYIPHNENIQDCDVEWIQKNYITITPIMFNRTNHERIKDLEKICIRL